MQKKQTEWLAPPPARAASVRGPEKSPPQAAEALIDGRHEAVGVDGMIDLQRTVGNRAVSSLIAGSPVVVARAPVRSAPKLHARPDNDPAFLKSLPVERLIRLYVTKDVLSTVDWEGSYAIYDQDFIQDKAKNLVERLIRQKLETEHDSWSEETLYIVINSENGDKHQTAEAKNMVEFEYRQTPGDIQATGHEADLRNDAKNSIIFAVQRFGKACQKQKEEIRAEIAEEKERNELILSFVEIGFSFIPGAPAVVKALDRLGDKKELAVKGIEATLKLAQMGLKSYVSSHQTGGEDYIDKLDEEAEQIARAATDQVNAQPDAEVRTIKPYYDSLEKADFENWIASKLLAWKKSAGHVGETRFWEFGMMGGDTQAAKLDTGQGWKFALITYPEMLGAKEDYPVFLDWIPDEMLDMTKQKSFEKFGPFKNLPRSDYKVPSKYETRFAEGLPKQRAGH
jgi:hypothetical protein